MVNKKVVVKLYRIPQCELCDDIQKKLREFEPNIYDCSLKRNESARVGLKRILGKWFGYPLVAIQYEDIILLISGYYKEMINDIKKSIRELRKGD